MEVLFAIRNVNKKIDKNNFLKIILFHLLEFFVMVQSTALLIQ